MDELNQIEQIDSSKLIGKWHLSEKDAHYTDVWYLGDLPEIFWIDSLSQMKNRFLKASTENGLYPFFVNDFSSDSLKLLLHPGTCKCEGLEIEYQKRN